MWPGVLVQQIVRTLPAKYMAEPRARLGTYYEFDICAFEDESDAEPFTESNDESAGGVATAVAAATRVSPAPTLTVEAEFPEQYAYEVLIFDTERERRLVAAIEIVSPGNKDRPDSRTLFVAQCAHLLRQDVCVSLVDLVRSAASTFMSSC